jgi:hypothetical protein
MASLGDDLADVYRDLKDPLLDYDRDRGSSTVKVIVEVILLIHSGQFTI